MRWKPRNKKQKKNQDFKNSSQRKIQSLYLLWIEITRVSLPTSTHLTFTTDTESLRRIYILVLPFLGEMEIQRMSSITHGNDDARLESAAGIAPKKGMVLPFTPLAMSFDSVNYFVDMPPVSILDFFFFFFFNLN